MAKTYLEPTDIKKLEEAAKYLRDRILIRLLFHLGCRVSELLGIEVDSIDFNRGTVSIQHLKTRIRLTCPQCRARLSREAKFCPGCGNKVAGAVSQEKEHRRQRLLPVDEKTLMMLKEYIVRSGPVFYNGRRLLFGITRGHAWKIISQLAEKAGLGKLVNPTTGVIHNVSPHCIRDAFAVHAVKKDGSVDGIRLLQEHLGHQSISTTMRYRKVSGEEQREWYGKLWAERKDSDGVTP